MPKMDIKERRKALGWSRSDLATNAHVDPRTLQLIELGQSNDDESFDRCKRAIEAAERGLPFPNFAAELEAIKAAQVPFGGVKRSST